MSSSNHSNVKFYVYTVITLAGSSLVAAGFVVPRSIEQAQAASVRYTAAALTAQGSEAALNYRLAHALDSSNQAAAIGLARVYLANGRSDEAFRLLEGVGDNRDALRLRLQTLLELGSYEDARSIADKLASGTNESNIVLCAAAYKLGSYQTQLDALDGRLTSVEALQALSRLRAGNLPLGLQLRALGLPNSAYAILTKQPVSVPRNHALAEYLLQRGDDQSLEQADAYLATAIKLDPANPAVRATYAAVLTAQKNLASASAQDKFALKLRQGKF